ncbi:competence protein CoiA family protein, partial [Streptococcus pyogenes]
MLTALNQDSQLINLLTQEVKKSDTFNCPGCGGQVRLKAGKIMRRHFAHVS